MLHPQALRPVDSFRRPLPAEGATFSIPRPAHLLPFAPPNSAPPPNPSNYLPSLASSIPRSKRFVPLRVSMGWMLPCIHLPASAQSSLEHSLRSWINRRCGCAAHSLCKSFFKFTGTDSTPYTNKLSWVLGSLSRVRQCCPFRLMGQMRCVSAMRHLREYHYHYTHRVFRRHRGGSGIAASRFLLVSPHLLSTALWVL